MDNRPQIHFQDEEFIRKNSLQCKLFIQVEENFCKILICDKNGNIHDVEELSSIDFLTKKWPFINLKFAQSTIVTLPKTFIFIPQEFENTNQKTLITPFLDADSPILNAKIKDNAINTYFTVDKQVQDFQNLLSVSQIIPSANLLIQNILSAASETIMSLQNSQTEINSPLRMAPSPLKTNNSDENTEVIGINLYPEDFEIVYVKNKKFIFYNRFPKANADDFNYYLLSTFEQFGIQAASANFYLTGNIDTLNINISQSSKYEIDNPLMIASSPLNSNYANEYYRRLSKYSSHIHFLASSEKGKISTILDNQFFLLSELSKCV